MLGSLGFPELLFILVLALLIFGPRKLPEVGRTLGKALGEFRRATSDLKRSIDLELNAEEKKSSPASDSVQETPRRVEAPEAVSRSSESDTREESETAEKPR